MAEFFGSLFRPMQHAASEDDLTHKIVQIFTAVACQEFINPLCCHIESIGLIKLVHWPLMGGMLHLVQRERDWAEPQPAYRPLLAVPNVTAHPSTASVPITVLLYNDPLLCGFNVPIKGLKVSCFRRNYAEHYYFLSYVLQK